MKLFSSISTSKCFTKRLWFETNIQKTQQCITVILTWVKLTDAKSKKEKHS